jgi:hypothetical protein
LKEEHTESLDRGHFDTHERDNYDYEYMVSQIPVQRKKVQVGTMILYGRICDIVIKNGVLHVRQSVCFSPEKERPEPC